MRKSTVIEQTTLKFQKTVGNPIGRSLISGAS